MKKIRRIIAAFLWSRATYFYYKKDFLKSLYWYKKFMNISEENKKSIALYATILALTKSEGSITKQQFERSLYHKPTKSIEESSYIDFYCKLYIEIITSGSCTELLKLSLTEFNVGERLRRLLPVPIDSGGSVFN